jgi:Putative endonuclease segE, GIY-YIG domain
MSWKYNGEDFIEIPNKMEGFVYIITNLTNNKKYIGKKHFWTRQKDRKTGRRKTQESDWMNYFGSCDELKEDVKLLGQDNFLREILYLCPHKKSMSYYETYEQFNRNVLFSNDYYNTNIGGTFYMSESERIYGLVLKSSEYY